MDAPNPQHAPRWDPAPLEETLSGARALTVSVADQLMRDAWEQLAAVAGIPARRWRRHHPVGRGPLVQIVEGEPAFDAAAWRRFASLVPGAVALPSRTAAALGVALGDLAPPGRRPFRLLDLWRSRRLRKRLRRAGPRLEAELEVAHARLREQLEKVLAPGDDGTPFDQLPGYALASRLELALHAGRGWRVAALTELSNGFAIARLMRLLQARGSSPGSALLELAQLTATGNPRLPRHLVELERVAALDEPAREVALATWCAGLGGWHAMRDLLLEAPPLRDDPEALRSVLDQLGASGAVTPSPVPAADPELLDAVMRARALVQLRERSGHMRADLHAALRAVVHALARRLQANAALPSRDAAFDLHVQDLVRAARGAATPARPLPAASAHGTSTRQASAPNGDAFVPELRGIPGSAGVARGRVVVVENPALDAPVEGGVLVCSCTDPAWLPLLLRCSALVTERGGPLSHGAILARELGLPAVVGATGACAAGRAAASAQVQGTVGMVRFERH